jgi:hypothetical protein
MDEPAFEMSIRMQTQMSSKIKGLMTYSNGGTTQVNLGEHFGENVSESVVHKGNNFLWIADKLVM